MLPFLLKIAIASPTYDACVCSLSHVQLCATPWTVARQAPLSVEFPRQEYWSGLPFPTPGDLPEPGVKLMFLVSPASPTLAGRFFTSEPPGKSQKLYNTATVNI